MEDAEAYKSYEPGSDELVNQLVEDHAGWACSIARSVARGWNLDWQLDGLDGGAYEGLLFCARRYDPGMGVPFRAYARRRIHESSTEEARKSKSWKRAVGAASQDDQDARELSARLLDVFPELRDGYLPVSDGEGETAMRNSIRQLLSSASVLQAFQEKGADNPEIAAQYSQMLGIISSFEPVHQSILWAVYWKDQSMRNLAEEWEIDELVVIREHREILMHMHSFLAESKSAPKKKLRIRPGLRPIAQKLRKDKATPPFARFAPSASVAVLIWHFVVNSFAPWHELTSIPFSL